jgi:hypothetical protein
MQPERFMRGYVDDGGTCPVRQPRASQRLALVYAAFYTSGALPQGR